MKKLFLLLPLLILLSCGQPKEESKAGLTKAVVDNAIRSDDSLKAIIKANINNGPAIDTIFLGFVFNMTEKQTAMYYVDLVKGKKLIKREKDDLMVYPMTFDVIKANAVIAPEFYDGKLYKLNLVLEGIDDIATTDAVFSQTVAMYMKKYQGFTFFEKPDILDSKEKSYHLIKNNLDIFIHKTVEGTVVTYINMPQELLAQKKKSDGLDSLKTQTQKDI